MVRSVNESSRVYLARMDKGLSGADVWMARWRLHESQSLSALHVFKIGALAKIQREANAIQNVASAIDPTIPHCSMEVDEVGRIALLKQHFSGPSPTEVTSLREYVQTCSSADDAETCIRNLYMNRLKLWHVDITDNLSKDESYGSALDWWTERADLPGVAAQLGPDGIDDSLRVICNTDLQSTLRFVESLKIESGSFPIGPVHGDLHSQNVLVDQAGALHLIDFGWCAERWRAIDFLMLECSLKFLATPRHALISDLVEMETVISERRPSWDSAQMYSDRLWKIAKCVMAIRELAITLGAVTTFEQYMKGLALLTSGLSSLPYEINQPYMIHSVASIHLQLAGI